MYNLSVATAHTYFVGHGQWLVHNTCIGKTYGSLGTVVDHGPKKGILPTNLSDAHATQRLQQRNITEADIQQWHLLDTAVLEQANGAKYLYVTQQGSWVVDTDGILVTAYKNADYKGSDLLQLLSDMGIQP